MQRAHYLRCVDETVGERTAAVRANRMERVQPAAARPEYGHLLVTDREGASFTDRDLIHRAEPPRSEPAHLIGTFGN